jgi:hypothetical protein
LPTALKSSVLMQHGMNGLGQHVMGLCEFPHSDTPVTCHLGGNIGNKCRVSDVPIRIEDPLFYRQFPLLNLLYYFVDLCPLQGLVAIYIIDSFFDFFETFDSNNECANELMDRCHRVVCRG